jgi:hypothetical protein
MIYGMASVVTGMSHADELCRQSPAPKREAGSEAALAT